jgi:hypothetical protein
MFRSFLDHHQVHILALYGPNDGQGMTETRCPNEFI